MGGVCVWGVGEREGERGRERERERGGVRLCVCVGG